MGGEKVRSALKGVRDEKMDYSLDHCEPGQLGIRNYH